MPTLSGRAVMIVEDDYFIATSLAEHFRAAKAHVLGPFPTASAALDHTTAAEMAVLDLDLRDRDVLPLADQLMEAAIPFVFYTAQETVDLPSRFAHIALIPKQYVPHDTAAFLDSRPHEVSIEELLPRLRLSARLILNDPLAADRLVEATLQIALHEQRSLSEIPVLAEWLQRLMDKIAASRGRDLMH